MRSLENLADTVKKSILRFPFAYAMLAASVLLQFVYISQINNYDLRNMNTTLFANLIFFSNLSYMGLVSLKLLKEKSKMSESISIMMYLTLLLFTGIITIFVFPNEFNTLDNSIDFFKVLLITLSFLISPLIIPTIFSDKDNDDTYWNNVGKILRPGYVSFGFSLILFLGLMIAIGAASVLLGITFGIGIVNYISVLCFSVFGSLIYLSGIPTNLNQEFKISDVPSSRLSGHKYVYIPLMFIYTIILLLFLIRFAFTDDVPANQGVPFVTVFCLAGFYSAYSLYPLIGKKKFEWISSYVRAFAITSIPLILLYFFAIAIRIDAYGFTINRVFVVLIGLAYSIMTAQILLSKYFRLRYLLGIVLSIFLIFTFAPFINADEISKYSQASIFMNELESLDLVNRSGKIDTSKSLFGLKQSRLRGSFEYLADTDNLEAIEDAFTKRQFRELTEDEYRSSWYEFTYLFSQ